LEPPEADEAAAECEERFVDFVAVVADEQPFEVVEPGEGALDDPACAAESGPVPEVAVGDLRLDAAVAELIAERVGVVPAVSKYQLRRRRGLPGLPRTGGTRSISGTSWVTSLRLPPGNGGAS
jgi:hypothetical protein